MVSTLRGQSVALSWYCRTCNHEWPVTAVEREYPERRMKRADRRSITRNERRKA
jgi:hypothetical protein